VAAGSEVVVRVKPPPPLPPEIVRVRLACAVSGVVEESVTTKVKGPLDAAAGVPESTPAVDKLSPAGKLLPAANAQV
jgi:hypothetical protein